MNPRSLRISLVLPYVLLVSMVAMALGTTYYWAARNNIGLFSDQYMRETASHMAQAVHFHVRGSGSVLEAAFPEGIVTHPDIAQDLNELRTRFWVATSMSTNPNDYVYYGNEAGQSIALKRRADDEVELRLKLRPELHRTYYRYTGIRGRVVATGRESGNLDPRERVWYQLAQNTARHVWTGVYIDFTTQELVVTRARRVLAQDGTFIGVVATDVSLREISRFISSLNIGDQGRAFIVERDGKLIAATGLANLGLSVDGKPIRISTENSHDPVIEAAYLGVSGLLDPAGHDPQSGDDQEYRTTVHDEQGRLITVAARRIVDRAGLDWLAVVAIPRDALFVGIQRQIWLALGISLLAVLLTILIGMRIFGRVAHDVISLSDAVSRIRRGDRHVPIDVRRRDEVGDLARNFQAMQSDLSMDRLTGVSNRAAMDSLLDHLTQDPRGQPFAILFIDLNDFKPLNDQYGHDNGDKALVEIAQRLKSCLREDDLLAHLGGDEFVIVARGISAPQALDALKTHLLSRIEAPLHSLDDIPSGRPIHLGAAIGVACWPTDAATANGLLRAADNDMYRHKDFARCR
ncbi:MAG: diguanylate cyclase [Castellaniella sp.]|nr:diguanylate cyclase [Castellaniella sp.]